MEQTLQLHNMVLHTKVLGPGNRAAIWLQGCKKRCKGCMSPASRPLDGGLPVSVSAIVKELSGLADIEGVTISGGEPFLQAEALCSLLQIIHDELHLGIIIYTGYTLDELHGMQNPWIERILSSFADLVIDGEYVDELNDGGALRGSSNQGIHFMSSRYISHAELYGGKSRNTEVVASNKDFFFIGIPAKETLSEWKKMVARLQQEEHPHD